MISTKNPGQSLAGFLLLLILAFASIKVRAQLTTGLTRIKDTSFNNRSAYLYAKKSYPEIQLAELQELPSVSFDTNIVYGKVSSRPLKMSAFYPKTSSRYLRVGVIIIHGGGWRSGSPSQHAAMAEQLAALGYVCFLPEYRLSVEALFPAGIYDIKAAIRFIRKNAARYNIDTARIVAAGFSGGAEMASFMATTGNMPLFEGFGGNAEISSNVNAVINIDGTVSFVHPESSETTDTSNTTGASTYWFGYSQKENYGLLQAASPLSYVGSQTPPGLFINSSIARMHAGRDDYIRIMNRHDIYNEVHTFDNSPHAFCLFHPWFEQTINYMDAFLKKVFNLTSQ
jgi:acetyl esterase/lipase